MFHHSLPYGRTRHQELEADYMARAILMPIGTMATLLQERDYAHMNIEEKKKFAEYVSDRFQVPIQHAVLRIKEVRLLEGERDK